MVKCRNFEMWEMSLSMMFGRSPKVNFRCGKCGNWSSGRGNIENVNRNGGLLIPCSHCGETNKIPVKLG